MRVAQAQGYDIEEQERIDRIHAVLAGGGSGRSSMLQDVLGRRLTEIDTINGAVVRAADEVGVDVPLNRAMLALVHGLERSWHSGDDAEVALAPPDPAIEIAPGTV